MPAYFSGYIDVPMPACYNGYTKTSMPEYYNCYTEAPRLPVTLDGFTDWCIVGWVCVRMDGWLNVRSYGQQTDRRATGLAGGFMDVCVTFHVNQFSDISSSWKCVSQFEYMSMLLRIMESSALTGSELCKHHLTYAQSTALATCKWETILTGVSLITEV
jgi:hypothetical protein